MVNLDRVEKALDAAIERGEITEEEARREYRAAEAEAEAQEQYENGHFLRHAIE